MEKMNTIFFIQKAIRKTALKGGFMFQTEQFITISFSIVLFLFGASVQLWLGYMFNALIQETENMATTEEEILYACKKKFSNCYRLYNGVLNVPVFVEKYLSKIKFGRFKITLWKQLSNQSVMFAILVAGIGVYRAIVGGRTVGEILPYYIVSTLGLYSHFAVSGFVDISSKKRMLNICLVDYLENHMGNKIMDLENSKKLLEKVERKEVFQDVSNKLPKRIGSRGEEKELEALLKEFLA